MVDIICVLTVNGKRLPERNLELTMSAYKNAFQRLHRAYPSLNLMVRVNEDQHSVHVVLPGLRFDDIDHTGQPNMSTLFDIMSHVETAAYGTEPTSFLCNLRLRQQNLRFYNKACLMEISSQFYETTTPKAPLDVKVKLTDIGNSTFTTVNELSCGGKLKPLIRMKNVNNLVHKKNDRPELLPDWWVNKFLPFVKTTKQQKLVVEPAIKPENTHRLDFIVPLSDTDHNERTRCSSYLRYFLNNTSVASRTEKLPHIKSTFHEFHIKRLMMVYFGASKWGDTLSSEIWQGEQPLTLYCQVSCEGKPLWFSQMDLHENVFGLPSLETTQES